MKQAARAQMQWNGSFVNMNSGLALLQINTVGVLRQPGKRSTMLCANKGPVSNQKQPFRNEITQDGICSILSKPTAEGVSCSLNTAESPFFAYTQVRFEHHQNSSNHCTRCLYTNKTTPIYKDDFYKVNLRTDR